jgi:hypothetical protein
MLISQQQHASLGLTTPPTRCCNCGVKARSSDPLDFIETPLRRMRYFFVVGSELTIMESFPYCRRCQSSAARVRPGWFSKILTACLVCAAFATVMVFVVPSIKLPALIYDNIVKISGGISLLLTFLYFQFREAENSGRSYYQPVSLADADQDVISGAIYSVTLRLRNWKYAHELADANVEMMRVGVLKMVSSHANHGETRIGEEGSPAGGTEVVASKALTWMAVIIVVGVIPWAITWMGYLAPTLGLGRVPWILHFVVILALPLLLWGLVRFLFAKE